MGTPRAFGHSRHASTWGTRKLDGHLGTQELKELGHSGNWALETLETLYLVDSII